MYFINTQSFMPVSSKYINIITKFIQYSQISFELNIGQYFQRLKLQYFHRASINVPGSIILRTSFTLIGATVCLR